MKNFILVFGSIILLALIGIGITSFIEHITKKDTAEKESEPDQYPILNQTFVTQTSNPNDMRCGAFVLAFYQWLKQGKTVSSNFEEDYALVDSIYPNVKFGEKYESINGMNLSFMSCPIKILDYAASTMGITSTQYYWDDSVWEMNIIHDAILEKDSQLFSRHSSRKNTGGIPDLETGQFAIVVFSMVLPNGTPISFHWILFHKIFLGYVLYDPFFGIVRFATEEELRGTQSITVTYPGLSERIITSLNSGIILP